MITKSSRKISYNTSCTVDSQQYTLYTCPANCRAEMSMLFITNAAGNVDVSIVWDRANGTDAYILGGKNFGTGEFIQFTDGVLVFEPGDVMYVTAVGSTPHVDVLCTVEEIFKPIGG